MTEEEFERFLNWLDVDRESAAQKYEKLRRSLAAYFIKRQCAAAEDLADEVLNRAMQHALKETTLLLANPLPYIFGIARNVYRQYINKQLKTNGEADWHRLPGRDQSEESFQKERLTRCLHLCLQSLRDKDRMMFVLYYTKPEAAKEEFRLLLAEEFGLTINALRLKMMRMRERLRDAISDCLQKAVA